VIAPVGSANVNESGVRDPVGARQRGRACILSLAGTGCNSSRAQMPPAGVRARGSPPSVSRTQLVPFPCLSVDVRRAVPDQGQWICCEDGELDFALILGSHEGCGQVVQRRPDIEQEIASDYLCSLVRHRVHGEVVDIPIEAVLVSTVSLTQVRSLLAASPVLDPPALPLGCLEHCQPEAVLRS
jgi:hypothetical protein